MDGAGVLVPVLVLNVEKALAEFWDHCVVNERLTERVSKDYQQIAKRYLNSARGVVSKETVKDYLSKYLEKAPKTYNNQLDGLRALVQRFLKHPEIMQDFRKAYEQSIEPELPSKQQIKKGFYALTNDLERALYLLYATSGLRKNEVLNLGNENVDFHLRYVRACHDTRTKKSGVTFYNNECAEYLDRIKGLSDRLFKIGSKKFRVIWDKASKGAGFRITSQVLRRWHATELGELGVPDRFVDIFQGRAPRSVLAKHYTGKGLERLKRIYDKAELRILS